MHSKDAIYLDQLCPKINNKSWRQSLNKITAGNWNKPAPPPEIAENVLEKKDIKKIVMLLYIEWSWLSTNIVSK